MKKLILAFVTTTFIGLGGLGGAAVHAQDDNGAVDCADQPSDDASDPCYNPAVYPPTTPASSVAPPTTSQTTTTQANLAPPTKLPQTGSGISPILGMGALLVLGGGLIVVAARRRSTSTSPAA